jgi:xylan 1,4-beta-xylosidase
MLMRVQNPILPGFNPDPSIVRVGDTYYMATSTFEWFPGIKLYKSNDLIHWSQCGYALTRKEQLDLTGLATAHGVWAPCLTYNEEQRLFYLSYSVMYSMKEQHFDLDNFVVTTEAIGGEWSNPVYLNSSGFDPSFFHDEDGKIWVTNLEWEHREAYQHPGWIIAQEYDPQVKALIGDVHRISKGGTRRGCAEGPHLYKRDGYYYLMTAEGGTGYGHAVVLQRSKQLLGAYEQDPNHVVLTAHPKEFDEMGVSESTKLQYFDPSKAIQKAGHGCLVQDAENNPYVVHLCSRPLLPNPACILGRETAIQRCFWSDDGWLRLANGTTLIDDFIDIESNTHELTNSALHKRPYSTGLDTFKGPKWLDDYQSYRLPLLGTEAENQLTIDPATLTDEGLKLRGQGSLFTSRAMSLLARRLNHFNATVETIVTYKPKHPFESAGLTLFYSSENFYYLRVYFSEAMNEFCVGLVSTRDGKKTEHKELRKPIKNTNDLKLKLEIRKTHVSFYFQEQETSETEIGGVFSTENLSDEFGFQKFTGTFVGLFCEDNKQQQNFAVFKSLNYKPLGE